MLNKLLRHNIWYVAESIDLSHGPENFGPGDQFFIEILSGGGGGGGISP